MYKKLLAAAVAGALVYAQAAFAVGSNEKGIYVVDTPKIMAESAPSALGRKHIDDVQKALQESVEEVKKAWEKANEQQKAAAMNDAVIQLNRQLELEKIAVNRKILSIIREETTRWLKEHKGKMVISKDALLAVDEDCEITSTILDMVNKRTPQFAELPKVTVQHPSFDNKGNAVPKKQ